MGTGFNRRKKEFKLEFIHQCRTEIDRLRAENKTLKEDPHGVIAPFLKELENQASANQRASALAAALIKAHGQEGVVTLPKDAMDGFIGHRIVIKYEESPVEGNYQFSFEATKAKNEESAEKVE